MQTHAGGQPGEPVPSPGFTRADAALISVVFFWGGSYAIIKYAYQDIDPYAFITARFALLALAMVPIVWLQRHQLPRTRQEWLGVFLIGLTGVTSYQLFFSIGLDYTTASHSTLIVATGPIFTAVFAPLLGSGRIRRYQLAGLALSLGGVWVLVSSSMGDVALGADSLRGDLLTLVAAMSAGMGFALAGKYLGGGVGIGTMALAAVVGSLLIVPIGIQAALAQPWGEVSTAAWLALLYAALIAGALGYMLWYQNIGNLGAVRGSAYAFGIPVVGVILAINLLGEPFALSQGLGAMLVLLGVSVTRGWWHRQRTV